MIRERQTRRKALLCVILALAMVFPLAVATAEDGTEMDAPQLRWPGNEVSIPGNTIAFAWQPLMAATNYKIQIASDSEFQNILDHATVERPFYLKMDFPGQGDVYYWRVKAMLNEQAGPFSEVRGFTNGLGGVPTLLSPANGASVSSETVTFQWTPVEGATGYHIQVGVHNSNFGGIGDRPGMQYAGVPDLPDLPDTPDTPDVPGDRPGLLINVQVGDTDSFTTSGFPADGTIYFWRVKAQLAEGPAPFSRPAIFFNGEETAPPAPELTFPRDESQVPAEAIPFKAKPVPRATQYEFDLALDAEFTSPVVNSVEDRPMYLMQGLAADGETYYWRWRAGNGSGWGEYSEVWSFVNGRISPPELLSPVENAKTSGTSVTFNWTAPETDVDSYKIQIFAGENEHASDNSENGERPNSENARTFRVIEVAAPAEQVVVEDFPNDGSRFFWRMKAGVDGAWSHNSRTASFINGDSSEAPEGITLLRPGNGAIVFADEVRFLWTPDRYAEFYQIQVAQDADFTSITLEDDTLTASRYVTEEGELTTGDYFWRVRAGNSQGWSEWTDARNFEVSEEEARYYLLNAVSAPFHGGSITVEADNDSAQSAGNPFEGDRPGRPEHKWYPTGTSVTVTAVPADGYVFAGWRAQLSGDENPASLIMDQNHTVVALFRPEAGQLVNLSDIEGMPGDNVVLRVNLINSTDAIDLFGFELQYPSDVLEFTPSPQSDCYGSLTEGSSWTISAMEQNAGLVNVAAFTNGDGITSGSSGTIVEINFRVLDDAALDTTATLRAMAFTGNLDQTMPQECMFTVTDELTSDAQQVAQVTAPGSYRMGIWRYATENWMEDNNAYGPEMFNFAQPLNEWLSLCVYDEQQGQWTEGIFMFREGWGPVSENWRAASDDPETDVTGASLSAYFDMTMPAAGSRAAFGANQVFQAMSQGNIQAVAWSYITNEVTNSIEGYDATSLPYPCDVDEWMNLSVYNYDMGQWIEGSFLYRQSWQ
ncbi:MAG: InlB B-repeat-containing protein [Candidatus Sumerlaeia bacterium]